MQFTNQQIEKLIQLGGRIAHIADAVPSPPAGSNRFDLAGSLRPAITANDVLLTEMLDLLTSGAAPASEVLAQIVEETAISTVPSQVPFAERWAASFPATQPK
jgi:hypothetical protein